MTRSTILPATALYLAALATLGSDLLAQATLEQPVTPAWGKVKAAVPDASSVPDAKLRARIQATGLPWCVIDERTGIELLLVPPGDYLQGAHASDRSASDVERPQLEVRIAEAFYVGRFEVTNAQFRRWKPVLPDVPRPWWERLDRQPRGLLPVDQVQLQADDQPAVHVSWREAVGYCEDHGFRLPTEAEWEYFARAGIATAYPWGEDPAQGVGHANVLDRITVQTLEQAAEPFPFDDRHRSTAPVGRLRPNGFGLHDVVGNAWEWCADWYDSRAYAKAAEEQREHLFRVCRGGSWFDGPAQCRVSSRNGFGPEDQVNLVGFRVVREVGGQQPGRQRGGTPSDRGSK